MIVELVGSSESLEIGRVGFDSCSSCSVELIEKNIHRLPVSEWGQIVW